MILCDINKNNENLYVKILALKAETKEKKDCIATGRSKLSKIIEKATFSFYDCVRNCSAIGDSIRTKIQESHMVIFMLLKLIELFQKSLEIF